MQKMALEDPEIHAVYKRNYVVLACYLGMPEQRILDIRFRDTFDSKAPRPCCICGKRVAYGNYKRHEGECGRMSDVRG